MRLLIPLFLSLLLAGPAGAIPGFLCSGGPFDGTECSADEDCNAVCGTAPGVCVLGQTVCDGGEFDGFPCDCPEGACREGRCDGGPFAGDPCTQQPGEGACDEGVSCVLTHRVCEGGNFRGYGCVRGEQCADSPCVSTALFCDGGDFDLYSCVVDADCGNAPATGTCLGTGLPCGCEGDCSGNGEVTVDELLRLVNIALGTISPRDCRIGDRNGNGEVTVDEILAAVGRALNGCPGA